MRYHHEWTGGSGDKTIIRWGSEFTLSSKPSGVWTKCMNLKQSHTISHFLALGQGNQGNPFKMTVIRVELEVGSWAIICGRLVDVSETCSIFLTPTVLFEFQQNWLIMADTYIYMYILIYMFISHPFPHCVTFHTFETCFKTKKTIGATREAAVVPGTGKIEVQSFTSWLGAPSCSVSSQSEEMGHCFHQNPQISPLISAVDFYGMSFEVRILKDLGQWKKIVRDQIQFSEFWGSILCSWRPEKMAVWNRGSIRCEAGVSACIGRNVETFNTYIHIYIIYTLHYITLHYITSHNIT